jgi:hypothetical protein
MPENKMKKVWDNCVTVGEVFKSPSTKLKVELVSRDGLKYVNIREWYKKKSDNVWKPGLSGFAIPILTTIGDERTAPTMDLICTMSKALEMSASFKLEDEANAVWKKDTK